MKIIVLIILLFSYSYSTPCALRKYQDGYVCVCNITYCDLLEDLQPKNDNQLVIVSSSEDGLRFDVKRFDIDPDSKIVISNPKLKNIEDRSVLVVKDLWKSVLDVVDTYLTNTLSDSENDEDTKGTIIVDPTIKYQEMIGFGGAYTGAVAYLIDNLPEKLRHFVYKSYYSRTQGLGLNMMRIPIGGTDCDFGPWAYNEYPLDDKYLTNFTKIDDRDALKVRQIKELMYVTNNYDIKFLATSWSPPRWMKSTYSWIGPNTLKAQYYQTLADYHVKFLEIMDAQNITFWSISTGNEPWLGLQSFLKFSNLAWTPDSLAKYVTEYLGPTIRKSKFKNIKILVGEDQRFLFPWYFLQMQDANKKTFDYIDGFAVHWYSDQISPYEGFELTFQHFPGKFIINTEASSPRDIKRRRHPVLGSWRRAEMYILGMIEDFSLSVKGWVDWNLTLDEKGNPNYAVAKFDSSIIVNATSFSEIYKQPTFYAAGHFSKFILPRSIRIFTISTSDKIKTVAFLRPDKHIVIIIFNSNKHPAEVKIRGLQAKTIIITIPENSVHSLLYKHI